MVKINLDILFLLTTFSSFFFVFFFSKKGLYNDNTKSIAASDCQACIAGMYSASEGLQNAADCVDCVPGKYSAEEGAKKINFYRYELVLSPAIDITADAGAVVSQTTTVEVDGSRETDVNTGTIKVALDGSYNKILIKFERIPVTTADIVFKKSDSADASSVPDQIDASSITAANDISKYDYSCLECPVGTSYKEAGAPALSYCIACPKGQYADDPDVGQAVCSSW